MDNDLIFQQSRCISHELRNHLSICELYTEIIKKGVNEKGLNPEAINNAVDCIKKSLRIMNNAILDLKSLNNLNPARCDLGQLIEDSVNMARVYSPNAKITYDAQGEIYIDENKFNACIVNIIKNALEAGADKIEITARPDKVVISNNGAPISKEKQAEIFAEGFTTKSTGTGLGLHICKRNLEAQNAELHLAKSDKKSTVFEIRLLPV
jgi:signal transduction histidine kinase